MMSAASLQKRFFVTGTDTDAGKTYCSVALLRGFKALGLHCSALKPIASGVDATGINTDAAALAAVTGQSIAAVNPLCYALPTAPHLAAQAQLQQLSFALLDNLLPRQNSQIELVEGAGGWLLPLNAHDYLADWVCQHQWPVVLVVGVKLGCLNHSLLTVRELRRSGIQVLGYVANVLTPNMHFLTETLTDLQQRLQLPLLGTLPFASQGPSETQCRQLAENVLDRLNLLSTQ